VVQQDLDSKSKDWGKNLAGVETTAKITLPLLS